MKNIILLISLISLLASCSSKPNKKLFEHAGGTFKLCVGAPPSSNIARNITDVHSAMIVSQVMEGLISFDAKDLSLVPRIAESWTVSSDKKVYVFKIREGILFHPCSVFSSEKDRELRMSDIINSLELACKKNKAGGATPAYSSFLKGTIRGLDDFHQGKAKKIAGLSSKGNNLRIELETADANFLNKLANVNSAIASKKVIDAGKEHLMIGTGPFLYKGIEEKEGERTVIKLLKNEDYYLYDEAGNALPYLAAIDFIVEQKKLDELELFEQGETHYIEALPSSRISSMLEGRIKDFNSVPPLLILRNNPLLATNYYFFNMKDERFKNPLVRKAFNYAVKRPKITQQVLRGQAYENGNYGIVPPISKHFRGYDFAGVKAVSYAYNPELAKNLLAEAGYPNGENFGSVTLRLNNGDIHSAVAEEFSFQIFQTLGIHVNIDASSFEQKTQDANFLNGDLFRTAWFADYVSPASFLNNFYGKLVPSSMQEASIVNQSRYQNPKFDSLLEQANSQDKFSERIKYYAEAEKELMKDPPIIPLWYNGDIQLVYAKVRNFDDNPLNYCDFTNVYFKEWTKEEYENRNHKK